MLSCLVVGAIAVVTSVLVADVAAAETPRDLIEAV
ncbi:uncharacterized protein METZ01_LOCUS508441, partial [marine metagenome]